jgi:hypothetical protein
LKADEATKLVLFALTAHTLPSEHKRYGGGLRGYISKPIHMDGFLKMIEGAFGINKGKKKTRKASEIR